MQGSVSQPDLCLYFSTVQALKAHQRPAHQPTDDSTPTPTQPPTTPATPTTGHPTTPRWLAWLTPSPNQ